MRNQFTNKQLDDPALAAANQVLRSCVHCGMCLATCPSYAVTGSELDSPRGRIYLIKKMLEQSRPADPTTVKHLDRCLSCYNCTTTCPAGVDYRQLLQLARDHIAQTFRRPWQDRAVRLLLATTLTRPWLTYVTLRLASLARAWKLWLPRPLRPMLSQLPPQVQAPRAGGKRVYAATTDQVATVALLEGCVQRVMAPAVDAAALRLLRHTGNEVVRIPGEGCCGSLELHIGHGQAARRRGARLIRKVMGARSRYGFDTVISTTSGCGGTIKDYTSVNTGNNADDAAIVAGMTRDIVEVLAGCKERLTQLAAGGKGIRIRTASGSRPVRVAYHAACSLQHKQRITSLPQELLRLVGFEVVQPRESNLCCGSAGVYSVLEPAISSALRQRKADNIAPLQADVLTSSNSPCLNHIALALELPSCHTVQLLDWACGGACPFPNPPFELYIE